MQAANRLASQRFNKYIKAKPQGFASLAVFIISCLTNVKSTKSVKKRLVDFLNYSPNEFEEKNTYDNNIEFVNISKKFDSFELDNFSYIFEKGKKYALIGHSGSGKSLILNMLMKYTEQDCGEIYIDGKNIKSFDISKIAVCINQFEHLYKDDFENNITVYKAYDSKNIKAVLDFYQCSKIELIKDTEDCTELSGGERQLLCLVKILLMNKDIILLDEPFSALDIKNTISVQDKLYSIKDKTFIVVTHNLSENNLKYFDEVIIMNKGKIIRCGKTYEVIKSKEYIDLVKNI